MRRTLPAKGRFLFKNKGNTGVPHFVILQQVVEGTTTDQVLEFLQSGDGEHRRRGACRPGWRPARSARVAA